MQSKPCPHCGEPKHPLKACPNCGRSKLLQQLQERPTEEFPDDTPRGLATPYKTARDWLKDHPTPKLPLEKLWTVQVYDGWLCPTTANIVQGILQTNPHASLQRVHRELLQRDTSALSFSPLWWIGIGRCRKKALYRDADGFTFIRVDKAWRLAYALREMGGLVGAKSLRNPHEAQVPWKGYFVCWENEEEAYHYFLKPTVIQEADSVSS